MAIEDIRRIRVIKKLRDFTITAIDGRHWWVGDHGLDSRVTEEELDIVKQLVKEGYVEYEKERMEL